MEAHHDFPVDDMDAVAAEADQLKGIPFAVGPFGIHQFHTAVADRRFLHEEGGRTAGIKVPEPPFQPGR